MPESTTAHVPPADDPFVIDEAAAPTVGKELILLPPPPDADLIVDTRRTDRVALIAVVIFVAVAFVLASAYILSSF